MLRQANQLRHQFDSVLAVLVGVFLHTLPFVVPRAALQVGFEGARLLLLLLLKGDFAETAITWVVREVSRQDYAFLNRSLSVIVAHAIEEEVGLGCHLVFIGAKV